MGKSSKKSKDTIMKDTASAKTNTTMDVDNPPVILRVDTQGQKGTGSEESIPVAEK